VKEKELEQDHRVGEIETEESYWYSRVKRQKERQTNSQCAQSPRCPRADLHVWLKLSIIHASI
jgi:hypothetical protein